MFWRVHMSISENLVTDWTTKKEKKDRFTIILNLVQIIEIMIRFVKLHQLALEHFENGSFL